MQIKRFEAKDMSTALRMVKKEFGADAVILSAKSLKNEKGILGCLKKSVVEVTAATDDSLANNTEYYYNSALKKSCNNIKPQALNASAPIKKDGVLNSIKGGLITLKNNHAVSADNYFYDNIKNEIKNLYNHLVSQGVKEEIAQELISGIKKNIAEDEKDEKKVMSEFLKALEKKGVSCVPVKFIQNKLKNIAFIGPTGVGKTTTIAKLAAIFSIQKQKDVGLISLDNSKVAASKQLKVYAKIIGVSMETASNEAELIDAIKKFNNKDVILYDTEGVNPKDKEQINRLKSYLKTIQNLETHLLIHPNIKEKVTAEIIKEFKSISVSRLLFTKLDECFNYGSVFNHMIKTKIPASYFTDSRHVPDGIKEITMRFFSDVVKDKKACTESKGLTSDNIASEYNVPPDLKNYFIANKNSDIFHVSNCKAVERIKKENILIFKNADEAIGYNLKPCRMCTPVGNEKIEYYSMMNKKRVVGKN